MSRYRPFPLLLPATPLQAKDLELEDKEAALTSTQQRVEALEKDNEDKNRLLKGISQVGGWQKNCVKVGHGWCEGWQTGSQAAA